MALYFNGQAPVDLYWGEDLILQAYMGEDLVYDVGERPALVFAPRMQATAALGTATTFAGQLVIAPPMTASTDMIDPILVFAGATANAPAMGAAATLHAPVVTVPATILAPVMESEAVFPEAEAEEVEANTVVSPRLTATADMLAPEVSAGVVIQVPPMTAQVDAFNPGVTGQANVPAPVAAATAAAVVPSAVTAGATIVPTPFGATASGVVPVLHAGQTHAVPAMTATAALAIPATGTGVDLSDTFTDLSAFTTLQNAPTVTGGLVRGGTSGASNQTTLYAARHNTQLNTDTQEVTVTLAVTTGHTQNTIAASTTGTGGGFLRANSATTEAASTRVSFGVTRDGAYIKTHIGGTTTTRASNTSQVFFRAPCTVGLRAIGNVYEIILDDIPSGITWTDSGNLVSQSNHYWGIEASTTENISGSATYGFALASCRARDWAAGMALVSTGPWMRPTWGDSATYAGWDYRTGGAAGPHLGVDVAGPSGRNIYAAAPGEVITVANDSSYGNYIQIDHGDGIGTNYAHLISFNVSVNDMVDVGDIIGFMGTTGGSTTEHLHFDVWRSPHSNGHYQDPERFLDYVGALDYSTSDSDWATQPTIP